MVSKYILSTFVDSIKVFDCRLSGVNLYQTFSENYENVCACSYYHFIVYSFFFGGGGGGGGGVYLL